ncbi:MAG: hypothetical protein SWK90_15385 [Chloroflexota bacterium]|nr:hypothetical protein [Chloroflexota bacterium]
MKITKGSLTSAPLCPFDPSWQPLTLLGLDYQIQASWQRDAALCRPAVVKSAWLYLLNHWI